MKRPKKLIRPPGGGDEPGASAAPSGTTRASIFAARAHAMGQKGGAPLPAAQETQATRALRRRLEATSGSASTPPETEALAAKAFRTRREATAGAASASPSNETHRQGVFLARSIGGGSQEREGGADPASVFASRAAQTDEQAKRDAGNVPDHARRARETTERRQFQQDYDDMRSAD